MVALVVALPHSVLAETIWCKQFKLGCTTPQERASALQFCRAHANESYQEALAKAIADPWVWKLDGYDSAQDYARASGDTAAAACRQYSPELSD